MCELSLGGRFRGLVSGRAHAAFAVGLLCLFVLFGRVLPFEVSLLFEGAGSGGAVAVSVWFARRPSHCAPAASHRNIVEPAPLAVVAFATVLSFS